MTLNSANDEVLHPRLTDFQNSTFVSCKHVIIPKIYQKSAAYYFNMLLLYDIFVSFCFNNLMTQYAMTNRRYHSLKLLLNKLTVLHV